MVLAAAILLKAAQFFAAAGEPIASQLHALRPIHLFLAVILLAVMATIYLALRPKAVYLVDYACFRPSSNYRMPKATFLEHARLSPFLTDSIVNFTARILERSGMSDETCAPLIFLYVKPCYSCVDEDRTETELVVFSVIDDLLAKTCINLDAIDVVITNCSVFSLVPSIADMIVNRYKLRGDLRVINLSGMGSSAGVTAVGLAKNILQVMPCGSHVLVVSMETTRPNYYAGNKRSMQLTNILFRMGDAAALLLNSRCKARFRLAHVTRLITVAEDCAYQCMYQEEDDEGNPGVNLSKDLMAIAGDALKANITAMGALVLPTSEILKFLLFSAARKVLHGKRIRPYIPNFCMAFEHFCIHVGGPVVIRLVQRGLNLSDKHVEPARMTLHRFGNQSNASLWYQLAYIKAKGRMQKGDEVWMIRLEAGYKCNTAVWVCIQPSHGIDGHGLAASIVTQWMPPKKVKLSILSSRSRT